MQKNESTLYDLIGGAETIQKLVEVFPEDVRPVMEKQVLFLTQFMSHFINS